MSEISMTVGRYHGLTKAHHGVFHQMPDKHDKFIFVTKKHDPKDPRYPLPVKHREKAIREVAPKNTSVVPVVSAFQAFEHAVDHAKENKIDTINVHVGDDRGSEMSRIAAHKDFEGININVRPIDRENLGGHSGTALRAAARTGNTGQVNDMMAPVSNKTKKEFIQHMQSTNENFDYENIPDWFNLEEFYTFAEAFEGVQELITEQEMTKEKPVTRQMKLDNARSNPDGDDNVDRDRKRTDRAAARDKMRSNPWPELAIVRTTQDGKLRIIPKADFSYKKHELVTGNIKGLPPRGEVTPQASFSVMQEPDFEQSKTSKRLIQMFGLDSPQLGGGQMTPQGGQVATSDPEAAPMDPMMMMAPQQPEPPRLPGDGKEITGSGSIFADWDHSGSDLDAGIVHAWNSATKNNPFSGLLGDPDLDKIGNSETLESAGFRAIEKLTEKIPSNFEAVILTPGKEKVSSSWQQMGGFDSSPITEIYFKPKGKKETSKDVIKATMKIGLASIISNPIENGPPIFNAIMMTDVGQTISQDKRVKKLVTDTKKKLNETFVNISAVQAKTQREKQAGNPEIEEIQKFSNEISSKVEQVFVQNKAVKKEFVRESLTGDLKFGPESIASANHIITGNKDGTNTNITPITDEYIEMISDIPKMMLALKSPMFDLDAEPTEEDLQTFNFNTAVRMRMGKQQPVTAEDRKINIKNMVSLKEYDTGVAFGGSPAGSDMDAIESEPAGYNMGGYESDVQRYDDITTNYTDANYTGQFREYGTGYTEEYLRSAMEYVGDDIFKLMEFMQIGVESVDMEKLNFAEYSLDKSTKYNEIDIDGRTVRIPIDPNFEMITSEEVEYIDRMFDFIILEKNRNYEKEYDNFHSKPEQRANRSKRVMARRKKEKQVGKEALKKKDVDHKQPLRNGGSNDDSNLRIRSRSANRSDNGQRKRTNEEYGAGEMGTTELLNKYLRDTPGQLPEKKKVKYAKRNFKK